MIDHVGSLAGVDRLGGGPDKLAELVGVAGTMLGTIPSPLQALLGPLISQLPIRLGILRTNMWS